MSEFNEERVDALDDLPQPRWIDIADRGPDFGGEELSDRDVPILDEPPFITQVRQMEGGPYYVTADSGEQVPTDYFKEIDDDALDRALDVANRQPPEGVTPDGKATIPPDQRELLEEGGPASRALLATIDGGLDATTRELIEGSRRRQRKTGKVDWL